MKNIRKINPCQPGFGASCSLCCGSHNYDLGVKKITAVFARRSEIIRTCLDRQGGPDKIDQEPLTAILATTGPKLQFDGIQCPYVGILDSGGTIGCLIYEDPARINGFTADFHASTCSHFYCAAWNRLDDDEIIFAARLMGDWFYYGLLILDIAELKRLRGMYQGHDMPDEGSLKGIKERLFEKLTVLEKDHLKDD